MIAEKAYQIYFSIRLHFTSTYDVFESGTNFRGKNLVAQRKDFKLIFPLLKHVATERELVELCVSNHLYGHPNFLYDPDHAIHYYKRWLKNKSSLNYLLDKDLDHIEFQLFKHNISIDEYFAKHILSDVLSQHIAFESVILLDRAYPCLNKIQGFDCTKYITQMSKASKFVNKGALGHTHISRIDSFKQTMKGNNHGNIAIGTA